MSSPTEHLSVMLFGASGDLAKKKVIPAFFSLFCLNKAQGFTLIGCGRTHFSNENFQNHVRDSLSEANLPEKWRAQTEEFTKHCFFTTLSYSETEGYLKLKKMVHDHEPSSGANHLAYLALPPKIYGSVVSHLAESQLINKGWLDHPYHRIIIEKPFGEDLQSAEKLLKEVFSQLDDEQVFPIDHYLGKLGVHRLMALRKSSSFLSSFWNSENIKTIEVINAETAGVGNRGGYFNDTGLIRDMVQSHLLEVLAFTAMDIPAQISSSALAKATTNFIDHIKRFELDHLEGQVLLGQYTASSDGKTLGFLDEGGVPEDSLTETCVKLRLTSNLPRWQGTEFFISSGKRLAKQETRIKITFRKAPLSGSPATLEWELQPKKEVSLSLSGVGKSTDLSLSGSYNPSKYEKEDYVFLIDQCANGSRTFFLSPSFILSSWRLFTPLLNKLANDKEMTKTLMRSYQVFSHGPFSEMTPDFSLKNTELPTYEEAAQYAAEKVLSMAKEAIQKTGSAIIALSGGSAPRLLFEKLAESSLEWDKTYILFSDERFVSHQSSDSNYYLADKALFNRIGGKLSPSHVLSPTSSEGILLGYRNAIPAYEKEIGVLLETLDKDAVDITLLGIGPDGHTASLFPGSPLLSPSLTTPRIQGADAPDYMAVRERVTFSLPFILASKTIMLFSKGSKKKPIIDKLVSSKQSSAEENTKFPVTLLKGRENSLLVFTLSE